MAGPAPFGTWIVVATAVIWVMVEVHQSIRRRSEAATANWVAEITFRIIIGAGGLAAGALKSVTPSVAIRPTALAVSIGIVLFWNGILLRVWSFRTLGRYFTFVIQTSSDQPIITTGPYRVIRHPSYAGLLLVMMAVGMLIGNWWAFASLTAATTAGLVYRIRIEERALTNAAGDDYRTYLATHKRLVPFIW